MSPSNATGARLQAAPATLPEVDEPRPEQDVDRELLDLLCDDPEWLDETFRELVSTSWPLPPRAGRHHAYPRPRRRAGRRGAARGFSRGEQWRRAAYRRQRSPPDGPATARVRRAPLGPVGPGRPGRTWPDATGPASRPRRG
jgi:hypothetical protein